MHPAVDREGYEKAKPVVSDQPESGEKQVARAPFFHPAAGAEVIDTDRHEKEGDNSRREIYTDQGVS